MSGSVNKNPVYDVHSESGSTYVVDVENDEMQYRKC